MTKWISAIFRAGQVNQGNIVRRSIATVAKNGGMDKLKEEVKQRNFSMAKVGNQVVILCDASGTITPIT